MATVGCLFFFASVNAEKYFKFAECLLLFPLQFDGENMYMSMTEPSQDYVPASQVG